MSGTFATVQDALSSVNRDATSIEPQYVATALEVLGHGVPADQLTLTVDTHDLPLHDILHMGGEPTAASFGYTDDDCPNPRAYVRVRC